MLNSFYRRIVFPVGCLLRKALAFSGLSSNGINSILVSGILLLLLSVQSSATTYYSRSSGANWNATNTWSTVTYGGTSAGTYPVAGDIANIADGITIFVNTNSACASINIGQGTSGILQFASSGSYTLTVSGNITINSGAKLWYNSNNTRTHTLSLGGNLVNDGTVDFIYDSNDRVNITFSGSTNSVISGSGSWTLNNVTMSKTSITAYVDMQATGFEAAIATFATTEGTYIHNNSSTYSINSSSSTDYTINENTVFKVPQGVLKFSEGADILYLYGQLYVNGGDVYIGSTVGTYGFRYAQVTSVPYLEVSAGTMTVYGGFNTAITASSDPLNFSMTGGTILLNCGSSGTSREVFNVNDVASSTFQMSGGTIIIQDHNGGGGNNYSDFSICGSAGTVNTTGGTIQFGNSSTPNNATLDFTPFANVVQPNFKVTGPTGNTITLSPSKSATADFKVLSLYIDTNKTFDNRSIQGVPGDNRTMTITSTYDGTYGFYNRGTFSAQLGTVTFSSSSPQSIGGSANTSFYNLTINSSSYVTLASPESVTDSLTMTSGKLYTTSTNILTCTSGASANIGSSSSYIDGPMIHTIASNSLTSKNYPIGKGSSYRPSVLSVAHSNTTSVTYKGEVINSSAAALGYNLPSTISHVSYTRYWNFTRQPVANFTSATMQLYYDVDDSVTDMTAIRVVHDDGSSNWVNYYGSGTANVTGSITSTSIGTFNSKFTIGWPPATLPIELLSFNAKNDGDKVACEWTTVSEINNHYFVIERSANGYTFDSLLYIPGAGSTNALQNYAAADEHPLNGESYYRLRQVDYDGKTTTSKMVHITRKIVAPYHIFPVPSAGNTIYINKPGKAMDEVSLNVRDMLGQEIAFTSTLSFDRKQIQLTINSTVSKESEAFIVSIVSPEHSQQERVLINQR